MSNEAKRKHIEEVLEDYIDVLLDNPSTSASAGYNVEAAQREVNELAAEVEKLRGQRDALVKAAVALLHSVTEGAIFNELIFSAARGYGQEDEATIKAIADTRAAIAAAKDGGDD